MIPRAEGAQAWSVVAREDVVVDRRLMRVAGAGRVSPPAAAAGGGRGVDPGGGGRESLPPKICRRGQSMF